MPFIPIRPLRPGTIDLAAQRIYEMLERERRMRRNSRVPLEAASEQASANPGDQPGDGEQSGVPRGAVREIDQQRAEQLASRPQTRQQPAGQPTTDLEPPAEYGLGDWIGDQLSGFGRRDYEDYAGARAAESEMAGSQLPGRESGPADAYRHILWAGGGSAPNGPGRSWTCMNARGTRKISRKTTNRWIDGTTRSAYRSVDLQGNGRMSSVRHARRSAGALPMAAARGNRNTILFQRWLPTGLCGCQKRDGARIPRSRTGCRRRPAFGRQRGNVRSCRTIGPIGTRIPIVRTDLTGLVDTFPTDTAIHTDCDPMP
jgi:hypothetical protein